MPKAKYSIEMAVSPWYAWRIISDSRYIPKIFPEVVSVTADPPSPASVGQRPNPTGNWPCESFAADL